ncbi:putative Cytochrome c oxidase subunit 8B mitochondrial protein [Naja naja]|nr:putative Cytochrome c oxidase subunit 8B mitochondrial protein [Naja naja]
MLALQKGLRLLNGTVRSQILPRAKMSTKPGNNSFLENAIGLTVIFAGGLFPICWVMGNLDSYTK